MFKKLLTLIMVCAIFTVQAHASTQNGLKAAFEELTFAVTVEWDQKDQNFYKAQMEKFTAKVLELQKQGMTNAQMIEFAKSQVKDAQAAKDLETAFSMISINKMSSKEASQYMMESMKRSFSQGASWNGDVLIYLAVGLLIVALAVGLAAGGVSGGGNYGGGGYYTCYDDCYPYEYQCGYDYWGPVYCWGESCTEVCY